MLDMCFVSGSNGKDEIMCIDTLGYIIIIIIIIIINAGLDKLIFQIHV